MLTKMKSVFSKKKESTFEEDIHAFWDFGELRSPTNKELLFIKNILDKRLVIIKGKPPENKNTPLKNDDVFSEILSDYESNKSDSNNLISQEDEVLDPSKLDKYFSSTTIDKLHLEEEKGIENAPTIEIKKDGDAQSIDLSKHFNLQEDDDDDFSSNYFSKDDTKYTPPLNTSNLDESQKNINSELIENNPISSLDDGQSTNFDTSQEGGLNATEINTAEITESEENQSILDENTEIKSQAVELSNHEDLAEIEEVKMDEMVMLPNSDDVDEYTETNTESILPAEHVLDESLLDTNEAEETAIEMDESNSKPYSDDISAFDEEVEEFSVSFDEDELYSEYDKEWAKDDQKITDDLKVESSASVADNKLDEKTDSETIESEIQPENLNEFQVTMETDELKTVNAMETELIDDDSEAIRSKPIRANEVSSINFQDGSADENESENNEITKGDTSVKTVTDITEKKIQNKEDDYRKKVNSVFEILDNTFQKFKSAHAADSDISGLKAEIQSLITIAEHHQLNFLQQFFIQLEKALSHKQIHPDKKTDIDNLLNKVLQIDILDKDEAIVLEKTNIVAVYINSLETKIDRQRENFKDIAEHKQMIDGKILKIDRGQRKIVRLNK